MPYLLFYACEHYEMSGILALVACGLYMAKEGKTKISVEAEHSVHAVWHYIGFTAETVIFGMTGLILGEIITKHVTWSWIALLFGLYFLLHVIRFGFMLLVMPILNLTGYEFNLKHCVIVSYGGLRGAVGLALALIVTHSEVLPEEIGIVTVFNISGIVLLTLVINGTTTGFIIKSLGLKKESKVSQQMLATVLDQHDDVAKEIYLDYHNQEKHGAGTQDSIVRFVDIEKTKGVYDETIQRMRRETE